MDIPSPRSSRRARIEIIPLIDIIFFLLAIFVMVSLSMVKSKGLTVNLPRASTGEQQDRDEGTWISVTADNAIYFNDEQVSSADLPARLQALRAENLEARVFINGDETSKLGVTIDVLDEVRRAGISKVSFQIKPKPK
jgi:biopolymer transport protein ExbD